jgi:protein-tyrosine phosphatase
MIEKVRILFVCMGNICRSPTAEGVFTSLLQAEGLAEFFEADSAGTHAYHQGEPPDPRAGSAALKRGIDLSHQRARRVNLDDFEYFDYIVAMDRSNLEDLTGICAPEHQTKLRLFLEFASDLPEIDVPDPYYGGPQGFERVLDLIELASRAMIAELRKQHRLIA